MLSHGQIYAAYEAGLTTEHDARIRSVRCVSRNQLYHRLCCVHILWHIPALSVCVKILRSETVSASRGIGIVAPAPAYFVQGLPPYAYGPALRAEQCCPHCQSTAHSHSHNAQWHLSLCMCG